MVEADILQNVREFLPELFCKENNSDLFVCQCFMQCILQVLALMNDPALPSGQAHASLSIYVITDQEHFHL